MRKLLEDPGTFIYVAFLAISLIAGYLKNLKKKREEAVLSPQPVVGDQRKMDAIVEQKRKQDQKAEQRLREMEAKARKAEMSAKQRTKRATRQQNNLELVELENEREVSERSYGQSLLSEEFDAKKAFIYSEIINPPYL